MAIEKRALIPGAYYAKNDINLPAAAKVQDSELLNFLQKTKKELQKRVLTLVDLSRAEISLTLWGGHAVNFKIHDDSPVIAVKGARVSDFNGVSLNSLSTTVMEARLKEVQVGRLPILNSCYNFCSLFGKVTSPTEAA